VGSRWDAVPNAYVGALFFYGELESYEPGPGTFILFSAGGRLIMEKAGIAFFAAL